MPEPNKSLDQMTAQERLDLGKSYYNEGKFDEAIKALSSIRRKDDPKTYARAQYDLGKTYDRADDLDEAIEAWSSIRRKDDPEIYAWAQYDIGDVYNSLLGKLDEAIEAWSSIRRKDDPETYARAQYDIGDVYNSLDKLDEAIEAWSNISYNDDPETYIWTQLNLGAAYNESGELDEAIEAWSNIRRKDDPETYAWAQYNLGAACDESKLDEAIEAWSNIRRKDDPEIYAWAQYNLGDTYDGLGKLDQAIEAWSNIHRKDDNPKAYARAQYGLGKIYENKGDLERAKEAYCNAQDFSYYNYERVTRILECPPELINDLHSLAKNTDKVRESLQIIPKFESKVAHYSRPSTAFKLFGDEKNNENPSNFRLSTIRGVNDPTEGLVLNDYWDQQGIPETIHTNDTATFISCFTFNHDNLNQFRLYGKENGREATGVSLVFNKEFFSDQSDNLEFIAGPSTEPSSKPEQIKPNKTRKTENDNKKELIGKSTLYRCIYLDPETWYWTLAQRDKSTFYRENKKAAKDQWNEYSTEISGIKGSVKNCLFDDNNSVLSMLKSISEELEESNAPEESHTYSIEEKQKILEAIRFILLPLQYLVKHIAFQEEQECRIMYTTHLHDEKIHHDWKTQEMYVEYEEPVLPHIDKIYLSPGSAKYQDFFRILLDQKEDDEPDKKEDEIESKVRISQNPFRNKE